MSDVAEEVIGALCSAEQEQEEKRQPAVTLINNTITDITTIT